MKTLKSTYLSLGVAALVALPLHAQFIQTDDNSGGDAGSTEETLQQASIVRGINAAILDANENVVKISWVPASLQDEYVIARGTVPISSRDLLLSAKSVGVVPKGVSFFTDRNVPAGKYYYAVAARSQIKSGKLFLYAGENYSAKPVTLGRATVVTSTTPAKSPPQVSLIMAKLGADQQSAKISWRGIVNPGVTYNVYRSTEMLSSAARVARADKIASIRDKSETYFDNQLPGPGVYYYAVATKSKAGGEERNLVPGQSYTRKGIRYAIIGLPIVPSISAKPLGRNAVAIEWKDIENAQSRNYSYLVYRHTRKIKTQADLQGATKLASARPGTGYFQDNSLFPGTYYYAIVTMNSLGQTSNYFASRQNATSNGVPIDITGKSSAGDSMAITSSLDELFIDFSAYARRGAVLLTWKNSDKVLDAINGRIEIYRFRQRPDDLRDLPRGRLVTKLAADQVLFEDTPARDGVFYYAIFLESPKGLLPQGMQPGNNMIGPVTIFTDPSRYVEPSLNLNNRVKAKKKKKKQRAAPVQSEDSLNRIIRSTYLAGEFGLAIASLQPFAARGNERVRAKALFYLALSNYKLRKYDRALDYLVHPLVVKSYDRRARFWYRRTLEKIK